MCSMHLVVTSFATQRTCINHLHSDLVESKAKVGRVVKGGGDAYVGIARNQQQQLQQSAAAAAAAGHSHTQPHALLFIIVYTRAIFTKLKRCSIFVVSAGTSCHVSSAKHQRVVVKV